MLNSEYEEMHKTAEIMAVIARNENAFKALVEAHEREDAQTYQSELKRLGLLEHCERICFWICAKRCVAACEYLCPVPEPSKSIDIEEMRKFAQEFPKLSKNKEKLARLVEAYERKDAKAFQEELRKTELIQYCRQVCAWFCNVKCRKKCVNLCPPPPLITHVGLVPTTQFTAMGYANGPSSPPGPTPSPNPLGGVGDHPFGGLSNIRGLFNIANPTQYKVEYATSPSGSWTPIVAALQDFYILAFPPYIHYYNRSPSAGWYNVADMGLGSQGKTYLTDWSTPSGTGDYYLRLTVKNAMNVEFTSPIVKVQVDNENPKIDQPELWLEKPDGAVVPLGCCGGIKKGDGIIQIRIRASDENFSRLKLVADGGCSGSIPIRDLNTGGAKVSRTYNGNIADKGEPVTRTVRWDPWAGPEKVDPCCYLIILSIWDRVIHNNYWAGGHGPMQKWVSLQIAI
jgi:hypothetical protein